MEVTNRSWASAHSTNWTSSVAPVSSSNAVETSAKKSSASGLVPCMIKTVRVPSPSVSPPPPPHAAVVAARSSAPVAATTGRRIARVIVRLPSARVPRE
jgi:hypothetical protein